MNDSTLVDARRLVDAGSVTVRRQPLETWAHAGSAEPQYVLVQRDERSLVVPCPCDTRGVHASSA